MVHICDAIMGSGKTQSSISYMNEHSDQKFIYITPYLDEANRIKVGCPKLKFVEPKNLPKYELSKRKHTAALIKSGKNITTTHAAFRSYDEDMLNDIRNLGYTLIVDEDLSMMEEYQVSSYDVQILIDLGYVKIVDGLCAVTDKEYKGEVFRDILQYIRDRNVITVHTGEKTRIFYWVLSKELVEAFNDVIILTYLFEASDLYNYFQINDIDFDYIGIKSYGDNIYKYCSYPGDTPEYVSTIEDKIHIMDDERLNDVGCEKYSLSLRWFDRYGDDAEQLRKNIETCYKTRWKDISSSDIMWSTYKTYEEYLCPRGLKRSFVPFNIKATNELRDKTHLIYAVNIYKNVSEKIYYRNNGLEVDDDKYALSIMIQWIWRSAIRDGQEIYLYIPSRRMRKLLTDWMIDVRERGNRVEGR